MMLTFVIETSAFRKMSLERNESVPNIKYCAIFNAMDSKNCEKDWKLLCRWRCNIAIDLNYFCFICLKCDAYFWRDAVKDKMQPNETRNAKLQFKLFLRLKCWNKWFSYNDHPIEKRHREINPFFWAFGENHNHYCNRCVWYETHLW